MSKIGHVTLADISAYLKNIMSLIARPIWMNPSSGAIRIVDAVTTLTTVTTVTTVTTCATVTSMTQIGGLNASDSMIISPMKTNWHDNVREQIT